MKNNLNHMDREKQLFKIRSWLHNGLRLARGRHFALLCICLLLTINTLFSQSAVFDQVQKALARGDYPLISIAKNFTGDKAHAIIACKVEEMTSGSYRKFIYVWGCNHPYNKDPTFYDGPNAKNILGKVGH
ncbi:hypothetical protein JXO59_14840 [candidate division KSB1 bacterium]|nr:hypothetical protein [candidate division KSB1 bacterium]